ncbi:MAG: hypothetical protein ACI4QI_04255, partial [Candidatus Coproplasma sp.]
IYIDNNSATHFKPVRDFCRICAVVLKYTLPFLFAFICNLVAFCVLQACGVTLVQNACSNAAALCAVCFGGATVIYLLLQLAVSLFIKDIRRFTAKRVFKILLAAVVLAVIDCGITTALVACSLNAVGAKVITDLITLILFCIIGYSSSEYRPLQ